MPEETPNEPAFDHDRLINAESEIKYLLREVNNLRDWRHDNASPVITIVQAQTKTNSDAIAALAINMDRMVRAVTEITMLPRAFEAHQETCVEARRDDMIHRDVFEEWVRMQFNNARSRQLTLHGTLILTLLGAMGTMVWYIITHPGIHGL